MFAATADAFVALAEPLARRGETEHTAAAIQSMSGALRGAKRSNSPLIGRLPVPLPRNQGLHPKKTELVEAEMSFNFHIQTFENVRVEDIFCEIQVCVRGLVDVGGILVELEDHWRIDTQKHSAEDGGRAPREAHPLFHYQRGGHAQDEFAAHEGFLPGPVLPKLEGLRALMQYPGPRIAVMPMCPTLALDNVLSQHDGPLWRNLRDIPEYHNLVAQQRAMMWELYDAALRDETRRSALISAVDW
ncbi:MAG: hypothetical protein ACK4HG_03825 [Agrobacterium albertimagni]